MSILSFIKTFRPTPRMTLSVGLLAATLALGATATADTAAPVEHRADDAVTLDDGDNPFKIAVKNATAKVGEDAKIVITIEAATGYKCNKSYPHKARKLEADDGAELAATTVKGSLEGKKVVIPVGVKATKAGTFHVRGQVKFSVCNDSQCVIKKVPLDAKITAS
jgi:hypothetical protein